MNKNYYHIIASNQPIYGIGDLHGDFNSLLRNIKNRNITDCSFINLGDCGLGFYLKSIHLQELREVNNVLKERNIFLYLFRGNHDDPAYFNREVKDDDEFMLSNIKVLPDYTVMTINDNNILIVGGATSIDRIKRKRDDNQARKYYLAFYPKASEEDIKKAVLPSYWENEQPFFDQNALEEITNDGIKISAVLTHTCPSFSYPTSKDGVKQWMKFDSNLEMDLMLERSIMDNIYSCLLDLGHEIKEWIYGHYHTHHESEHNSTKFITLINSDKIFDTYDILKEKEDD